MLKPYDDKEIYVCGEAYSLKQGWIEGALETCHELLHMIPSLRYYKKVKYEFQCNDIETNLSEKVINEQKQIQKSSKKIHVVEKKIEPKPVVEKKIEPKPVVEKENRT